MVSSLFAFELVTWFPDWEWFYVSHNSISKHTFRISPLGIFSFYLVTLGTFLLGISSFYLVTLGTSPLETSSFYLVTLEISLYYQVTLRISPFYLVTLETSPFRNICKEYLHLFTSKTSLSGTSIFYSFARSMPPAVYCHISYILLHSKLIVSSTWRGDLWCTQDHPSFGSISPTLLGWALSIGSFLVQQSLLK